MKSCPAWSAAIVSDPAGCTPSPHLPFSGGTGGFLWVIGLIAAVSAVTLWALAKAGVLK